MARGRAAGGRHAGAGLGAAILLTGLSPLAAATGFFLNQQSVQGLGRADAGNAVAATDASTVYYNPAGLPLLWQNADARGSDTLFALGAQGIFPTANHSNAGSTAKTFATGGAPVAYTGNNVSDPTDPVAVPNFFAAHRLGGGDGYLGLGVTSPFGLSANYGNAWFGRYDSTEVSLRTVNVALVGAWRLTPSFSIGGGLDAQYARAKLAQAIPNPLTAGGPSAATDGRVENKGTAWTPGFNIGFLWQADEATRLGLHYRSEVRHKLGGTVVTSGLTGALAAGNGAVGAGTTLKLPAVVTAGASRRIGGKLTLYGEVDWYGWGVLNELRVHFDNGTPDAVRVDNYRNTFAYAVGAEYAHSPALTLRGGVQFDFTLTVQATRDTTFPDANRLVFAAGASVELAKRTYLDLAGNYVKFRTVAIGVTHTFFDGTALASSATINDIATPHINTFSAQLRYAF